MARKAGLTRDQVVDAAAALADRDGLGALTMAAVAAEVGVRAPSLYSHVDGVDGLRRLLGLRASGLLAEAFAAARDASPDDPVAALRGLARSYRAFAHEHPGLYAALLPAPVPADDPEGAAAFAEPVAVVAAVLARLGVPPDRHVDVVRGIRSVLHGFADLELRGGFGLSDPVDASFAATVDMLVGALVPEGGAGAPGGTGRASRLRERGSGKT